jgi:hypothetical protein
LSLAFIVTLQAIVALRNVQINYEKMLDLHDMFFYDFKQLVPFFFLDQKIMIENQSPFPFNTLGFEIRYPNSLVLHSHSSFV